MPAGSRGWGTSWSGLRAAPWAALLAGSWCSRPWYTRSRASPGAAVRPRQRGRLRAAATILRVTASRLGRGWFGRVDELVVIAHGQARGRLLVGDHDRITMQLEGAGGHHAGDRSLDGLGNGLGLVLAARHQDQLARVEDGPDAHGDRIDRHVLSGVEEPG